jgi:hypothetical protein
VEALLLIFSVYDGAKSASLLEPKIGELIIACQQSAAHPALRAEGRRRFEGVPCLIAI